MASNALFSFLFLFICEMVLANEKTALSTQSCYKIDLTTMVAIISGDVFLTVLIVITAYHCASRRRHQKEQADKVYMNVRANVKA